MLLTIAHAGGRGFAGGLFFLGPLLFLLVVGLLIFLTIRRTARPAPWMGQSGAGLKVLEERYAGGEIDREEYLAKREDLTSWSRKRDKKT